MVIPSYWSRKKSIGWKKGDAIYDHPTPLNEEGTLKRLLESISLLTITDFEISIIAVPTSTDIAEAVEEKVNSIVSSVHLNNTVSVVGPTHVTNLKDYLIQHNQKDFAELISISGYSNIRNLCLLIPAIKQADLAILIDDDEVFHDPHFMDKALYYYRHPINENLDYGIAGYYVNKDGEYLVNKSFSPWMNYWDKYQQMNEAFEKIIGSPPRVKETPFVFGGNMIIPKTLYSNILFDPNVPRGEDIDYVINAKMYGYHFYLDNTLSITHLPPPKSHPTWKRLREDIFRFSYEREKIRQQDNLGINKITAEEFDPYPGCFLKEDLEYKIKKANTILAEKYHQKNEKKAEEEALKNADLTKLQAIPTLNPVKKYDILRNTWKELMCFIQDDNHQIDFLQIIAQSPCIKQH